MIDPSPLVTLGDGIEGLLTLPKGSAGLVLSDLPSGETQAPFDKRPNLRMLWHAAWQALRPDGVVVFMAHSLLFASDLMRSTPYYRYEYIWKKNQATGFLNAKTRPLRNHEYALVFFKEEGPYTPQMRQGHPPISKYTQRSMSENYGKKETESHSRAGATDRFPLSVLEFDCLYQRDPERVHPQQKPTELLEFLIRTHSDEQALVVDPYAGSGSTGRAAVAAGRGFMGWDSDPRFGHAP